jgi:hypothetical protein
MNSSEFNEEKLICTEYEQQGKRYIYKFKYCGKAHGIVNMYVPSNVITVMIAIDDEIFTCKCVKSIKYSTGKYKLVTAECFPLNLLDTSCAKISIIIKSYAHFNNTPKIRVMCEYVRSKCDLIDTNKIITDSKSPDDYYQNTNKYIRSRSKPKDIVSSYGSVPLSGMTFEISPGSASKGIGDILRCMDK